MSAKRARRTREQGVRACSQSAPECTMRMF